jgi:hypothetical protein
MDQQLDFLKKHGFVLAGVGLPVLLVMAFALARVAPRYMVEDPRFELVYVTNEGYSNGTDRRVREISVVDGRLRVRWSLAEEPVYTPGERVYAFDGASGEVRELPVPEAGDLEELGEPRELFFEGLEGVRLSESAIAPDGYQFESHYSGGGGIFGTFFSSGSRGYLTVIQKNARRIRVPQPSSQAYGYGNASLLGWAIPIEDSL